MMSVGLHSPNIYYDVSAHGTMTVVDGTALEFFVPRH